jgi:predicted acylesterase/phospholipase RssA
MSRSAAAFLALAALAPMLSGCASALATTRLTDTSSIDFGRVRVWADDDTAIRGALPAATPVAGRKQVNMLSLSGGGAAGAYGAGFLTCWSNTGTRPQFDIVIGTSVGALISPFAFLGKAHDPALSKMFTSGQTADLLQFAGLEGLFGTALFKPEPLRKLVDGYVTPGLLKAIATEYAKGRRLVVVTTDLERQQTAVWDMGRIASLGTPEALAFFKSVLIASTAIPGVFAPQELVGRLNGRPVEEMHVDGGVTANVMVIPDALLADPKMAAGIDPRIFVIVNGKLGPEPEKVEQSLPSIFERAYSTTLKTNTRSALLASVNYANERHWAMKVTAIPDGAAAPESTDFSTPKLRALFATGCDAAQSGKGWRTDI